MHALPQRKITRHDCVEGWSDRRAEGHAYQQSLTKRRPPDANFIVFHCADSIYGKRHESIDMIDAFMTTIIAHEPNGQPLPEENGVFTNAY